jgi:hypothetical protein
LDCIIGGWCKDRVIEEGVPWRQFGILQDWRGDSCKKVVNWSGIGQVEYSSEFFKKIVAGLKERGLKIEQLLEEEVRNWRP